MLIVVVVIAAFVLLCVVGIEPIVRAAASVALVVFGLGAVGGAAFLILGMAAEAMGG